MADHDDRNGAKLGEAARAYQKAAPYLHSVWQLVGSVAVGAIGGWALDHWLGTAPWLLLALSLAGIAAGFAAFIQSVSKIR